MKWYKHLVDSGDDPDIDDSFTLFGSDGPWFFFRTLEILSREFKIQSPGSCNFSVEYFRKKHRISWRKCQKVLTFFQQRRRILFRIYEEHGMAMISLNCPKLKELTDEYTQKQLKQLSGVCPDSVGSLSGIEAEVDKEGEEENIYSEIFECWNEQRIIKHAKLSDKARGKIRSALKDGHTKEDIERAIKNYAVVVHGDLYFWDHTWPLELFLARGLSRFVDAAKPLYNFLKDKSKTGTESDGSTFS